MCYEYRRPINKTNEREQRVVREADKAIERAREARAPQRPELAPRTAPTREPITE